MLMDNKGGYGGSPTGVGENLSAPENVAPMGEIPNFDADWFVWWHIYLGDCDYLYFGGATLLLDVA